MLKGCGSGSGNRAHVGEMMEISGCRGLMIALFKSGWEKDFLVFIIITYEIRYLFLFYCHTSHNKANKK